MAQEQVFTIYAKKDHCLDGYVWSEYYSAWLPEDQATITIRDGYVHDDETCQCPRCSENICHDSNSFEYMVPIVDADEDWCQSCAEEDATYYEGDDNNEEGYYVDPPNNSGLSGYHDGPREMEDTTKEHPFLIGFEIEKEDREMRNKITKGVELPAGWALEEDGSLDDATGFELISPAFNLKNKERILSEFGSVRKLLDAGYSKACGGHISISHKELKPAELADRLTPLFPLLMALYPKRLETSYSAPKKKKDDSDDRYVAFSFGSAAWASRGDRIELRIFSAVPSHNTLVRRFRLLEHCLLESQKRKLSWAWMKRELSQGGFIRSLLMEFYKKEDEQETLREVRRVIKLYDCFSGWYAREAEAHPDIVPYLKNYVTQ